MSMREPPPRPAQRGRASTRLLFAAALAIAGAGCDDDDSYTDLNTAGPPMVQQVFVMEREPVGSATRERLRLAFGDHPDIPSPSEDSFSGDDRIVRTAVAAGGNARLRVVFDELLRGNDLEEMLCVDGTYSRVPPGTTPDDIERCSGPNLTECEAVCVGPSGPIGIRDDDGDGAVDFADGYGLRMIDYGDGELAAAVECDGEPIPLIGEGPERSFYNPSGNQLIPADEDPGDELLALDGLGPALVLFPQLGLRSGATCTVTFRPEVVDKDGNQVCAPPGGDVSQDCSAGDTQEIQFDVEPIAIRSSSPAPGAVLMNTFAQIEFFQDIDIDTVGAVTLSTGGADVPVEVTQAEEDDTRAIRITPTDGFLPGAEYTVTVGTDIADLLGGTPDEPLTLTFTTREAAPAVHAGAAEADL